MDDEGGKAFRWLKSVSRPHPRATAFSLRVAPEGREELPGGNIPVAVEPRPLLPAREVGQDARVFRVVEMIVAHARRDESRLAFDSLEMRHDELGPIPCVPDAAGIRRRVDARTPVRLARARARRNVLMFPTRQRRGLLDPDHVVLQPEIRVDVLLALEMPRDNT